MPNDILKLADKTVVFAGPICSYTFDIVSSLSRQGASIVLLTPDEAGAQRICQVINDEREIHEDFGRAFPLPFFVDKDSPDKKMADAAHTFHGLDIYIDNMNWHDARGDNSHSTDSKRRNLELSTRMLEAALPFLKHRKRGKVIFLMDGYAMSNGAAPLYAENRGAIAGLIETHATELKKSLTTINGIAVELSEDFLIKHLPGMSLKEGLAELKKDHPHLEITRTEMISKFVTLLSCDLAQGATGQIFKLNV